VFGRLAIEAALLEAAVVHALVDAGSLQGVVDEFAGVLAQIQDLLRPGLDVVEDAGLLTQPVRFHAPRRGKDVGAEVAVVAVTGRLMDCGGDRVAVAEN
jgi:hypothetical protein